MTPIREEEEAVMKRWMIVSMLVALVGGCVVVPVGERYRDHDRDYRYDYRNSDIRHYG
jgi:hypothetical protein